MKAKFILISALLIFSMLFPTSLALGQDNNPPPPKDVPTTAPVVNATMGIDIPTDPPNWIKVNEVSYVLVSEGEPIQIKITEYQEPRQSTSKSICPSSAEDNDMNSLAVNYCSNPLGGSVNIQATKGGITQNWKTFYTRYNWSGPSGSPNPYAWYIDRTVAWWTRTDSTWTVSASHVQIGPTNARDCSYNAVYFGTYNRDISNPSWNGNTSYTYSYYVNNEGILQTAPVQPRCHWLGITTVKKSGATYGDIPKVKNCFTDVGITH